jgi:hypothetical protein
MTSFRKALGTQPDRMSFDAQVKKNHPSGASVVGAPTQLDGTPLVGFASGQGCGFKGG